MIADNKADIKLYPVKSVSPKKSDNRDTFCGITVCPVKREIEIIVEIMIINKIVRIKNDIISLFRVFKVIN